MTRPLPRPLRIMKWLFLLVAVFAFAPVLCVGVAALVAWQGQCQLDDAQVYPCQLLGVEVGETIAALGFMGWLSLVTLPTGAIAWGVLAVVQVYLAARYDRDLR